ncbi:hypothetical protein [Glycomyces buryatensis]|uniref:Uncharacterized protein n=1 Tax=Glycomyces buryatensis TaxID=2570927 RepID=A0A4S8QBZ4_9ACTN|nr:hypothetical protein [Glycomyces buryatensis]THV41878.1 hypothetical protein FAB82_09155 [Glycomyces buryatensis]
MGFIAWQADPNFKARPGWELRENPAAFTEAAGCGYLDLRLGHGRVGNVPQSGDLLENARRREAAVQAGNAFPEARYEASLVPEALVDGRSVASGWGRITVPLSPGRHLVEVQSRHSRAWRAVDIEAGRTAAFDYVGMKGNAHRSFAEDGPPFNMRHLTGYTIGPRGRLNYWQYLPSNAKEHPWAWMVMVGLFIGAMIPVILLAGAGIDIRYGWGPAIILTGWVVIPAITVSWWGVSVLWKFLRYNRCPPAPPLDTRPLSGPDRLAPLVLDEEGAVPAPAAGAAALVIDARFLKADIGSEDLARQLEPGQRQFTPRQERVLNQIGEVTPVTHRPVVPPPQIWIDGVEVAASWTRMWFELAPGEHHVKVQTPGSPLPVPGGEAPPQTLEAPLSIAHGQTELAELQVNVWAVPDPTEPILHRWACGIDYFGPERRRPKPARPRQRIRWSELFSRLPYKQQDREEREHAAYQDERGRPR